MRNGPAVDLTGRRFGLLVVVAFDHRASYGNRYWQCKCDCGNPHVVQVSNLYSGRVRSCGCNKAAAMSKRLRRHGYSRGDKRKSGYWIWAGMKQRCLNPKTVSFPRYGGRGIGVCDRWLHSFENFLADMGPRPEGASIDRINNNGNYEPRNCRWANAYQQMNNCHNSRLIECGGQKMSAAEWSRRSGVPDFNILWRIGRGWPVERAVFEPTGPSGPKSSKSVDQLSRERGLTYAEIIGEEP